MDVQKALRELYQEKKRLDDAISNLERRIRAPGRLKVVGTRGRKQMSREERIEVSRRMKLYWETRRAQSRALDQATSAAARKSASGSATA